MADTLFEGTIDIEEATIIPQGRDKQALIDGANQFKNGDKIIMQLTSSDISASLTWSLEISIDGTNWDVARDGTGTDITGTLVVDEPYVEFFYGVNPCLYRISLARTTETGSVSYILKDGYR